MSKTNLGLANYAKVALSEQWGYVWGTFGRVLDQNTLDAKIIQYPEGVGKYKDFIVKNWIGRKTTDCVGLIKSYIWSDNGRIIYDSKTDIDANAAYKKSTKKGKIETMPNKVGLCVWKEGHIGVYIGGGEVIEAHGTKYGVIKTPLNGAGATDWTHWLEYPNIKYPPDAKNKEFEKRRQRKRRLNSSNKIIIKSLQINA
jgi:hypothetical protein